MSTQEWTLANSCAKFYSNCSMASPNIDSMPLFWIGWCGNAAYYILWWMSLLTYITGLSWLGDVGELLFLILSIDGGLYSSEYGNNSGITKVSFGVFEVVIGNLRVLVLWFVSVVLSFDSLWEFCWVVVCAWVPSYSMVLNSFLLKGCWVSVWAGVSSLSRVSNSLATDC